MGLHSKKVAGGNKRSFLKTKNASIKDSELRSFFQDIGIEKNIVPKDLQKNLKRNHQARQNLTNLLNGLNGKHTGFKLEFNSPNNEISIFVTSPQPMDSEKSHGDEVVKTVLTKPVLKINLGELEGSGLDVESKRLEMRDVVLNAHAKSIKTARQNLIEKMNYSEYCDVLTFPTVGRAVGTGVEIDEAEIAKAYLDSVFNHLSVDDNQIALISWDGDPSCDVGLGKIMGEVVKLINANGSKYKGKIDVFFNQKESYYLYGINSDATLTGALLDVSLESLFTYSSKAEVAEKVVALKKEYKADGRHKVVEEAAKKSSLVEGKPLDAVERDIDVFYEAVAADILSYRGYTTSYMKMMDEEMPKTDSVAIGDEACLGFERTIEFTPVKIGNGAIATDQLALMGDPTLLKVSIEQDQKSVFFKDIKANGNQLFKRFDKASTAYMNAVEADDYKGHFFQLNKMLSILQDLKVLYPTEASKIDQFMLDPMPKKSSNDSSDAMMF